MIIQPIPYKAVQSSTDLLQGLDESFVIEQFCWDTRKLDQGDTFLCLAGENFDAHSFAKKAVEQGAKAVIAQKETSYSLKDLPVIWVEDTIEFLWRLARYQRQRFTGKVVAITGSNGKTSTRNMCRYIGSQLFSESSVYATDGNKNNHLGVPYSLLQLNAAHELAVLELGTNHPGEIEPLARLVEPHFSLITAIGGGHIGHFKDWQELAREKCSIAQGLSEGGECIIPQSLAEKSSIQALLREFKKKYIYPEHEIPIEDVALAGSTFSLANRRLQIPFPGRHMVKNLELIVTLYKRLGFSEQSISEAIDKAMPMMQNEPGRLSVRMLESNIQLVDDSYNANSESVLAALRFIVETHPKEPKALWLGEMGELGDSFFDEHIKCLEFAKREKFSQIVLFLSPATYSEYQSKFSHLANVVNRKDDKLAMVINELKESLPHGSTLLLKGSRSSAMEKLPGLENKLS